MIVRKTIALMAAVLFVVSIMAPVSFAVCVNFAKKAPCNTCVKPAPCNTCAKPAPCATCVKPAPCKPCVKPEPKPRPSDYYLEGSPMRKLGRGLSNCITFPFEIPVQVSNVNNSDGPFAALTYGLVKGIVKCCFRVLVGMYEVSTFPLPFPEGYKPIINDPEFMFEDWNA